MAANPSAAALSKYPGHIKNSFHKSERLCSRKNIDSLFANGSSATVYPIKVMFTPAPESIETKAMFVVPKRNFRKAHDRNKLRRRMKEAYRLNKNGFYESLKKGPLHIAFIYTGRKPEDYVAIHSSVVALLGRMSGAPRA